MYPGVTGRIRNVSSLYKNKPCCTACRKWQVSHPAAALPSHCKKLIILSQNSVLNDRIHWAGGEGAVGMGQGGLDRTVDAL